jgi:hypothetical protein
MTKSNSKLSKDHDQNLNEQNGYLEIQRQHKQWYESNAMGKQRGKPHYDMDARNKLKPKKEK